MCLSKLSIQTKPDQIFSTINSKCSTSNKIKSLNSLLKLRNSFLTFKLFLKILGWFLHDFSIPSLFWLLILPPSSVYLLQVLNYICHHIKFSPFTRIIYLQQIADNLDNRPLARRKCNFRWHSHSLSSWGGWLEWPANCPCGCRPYDWSHPFVGKTIELNCWWRLHCTADSVVATGASKERVIT